MPRPRATASQTRAAPAARPPTATDKQRALLQSLLDQVNRRAQDLRAKTDAATSAPGADAASPSASSDAIVDALADAVVARLLESPAGSESREDDGREVGPEDSDVLRQAAVDILSEEALRASTGGSSQVRVTVHLSSWDCAAGACIDGQAHMVWPCAAEGF